MSPEPRFPIMLGTGVSIDIPWSLLNEARAMINHSQDLATLARRGGLSPLEALANIKGLGYRWIIASREAEKNGTALAELRALADAHTAAAAPDTFDLETIDRLVSKAMEAPPIVPMRCPHCSAKWFMIAPPIGLISADEKRLRRYNASLQCECGYTFPVLPPFDSAPLPGS